MSVRTIRYNTIEQHFTKSALASTDRDALAFLEAAQIYNTNQQRAIVNLVRSLKRTGLWSKMKAIYPFIGGTATSHKWNLKDPQDTDAAFRLTFSGGWTHSSTGADPNGTNAWANTFLVPSSNLSQNSTHVSYYTREKRGATMPSGVQIGTTDASAARRIFIQINLSGSTYIGINGTSPNDWVLFADTTETGYYIGYRNSSTSVRAQRNATQYNQNVTSTGVSGNALYLAAYNSNGFTDFYNDQQVAFATIGDGLTDTEATNLYNIVDLYQKRLGRAV